MKYTGSCHCGNVSYEVEGSLEGALSCDCSICQRKGSLHPYAEATAPDGKPVAAINIRCLEGIDLESVPVTHVDGRSR